QPAVVAHHRTLPGRDHVGLRPAEADPDRQRALLGGLVDSPRIARHVQARDTEIAGRPGQLHDRVENRGRLLDSGALLAVAACLDADGVDAAVPLRDAEDLLDLLVGVALGDVDRLATE